MQRIGPCTLRTSELPERLPDPQNRKKAGDYEHKPIADGLDASFVEFERAHDVVVHRQREKVKQSSLIVNRQRRHVFQNSFSRGSHPSGMVPEENEPAEAEH